MTELRGEGMAKSQNGVTMPACDSPGRSQPGKVTEFVTLGSCDPAAVSHPGPVTLVLSLFPGIDLLGMGFEQAGFCVVRGPDKIYGGDIRSFYPPAGKFFGVIGGPPCQDFSKKRRKPPTGYGQQMLDEFKRVVIQAQPEWWLMENVPGVPDVTIDGYSWQRLDLRANEFGLKQSRLRHFQYGGRNQAPLIVPRGVTNDASEPCALASEGEKSDRRSWPDFCELQGLSRDFSLPGMSTASKYRAVGNGVPVPMAYAIAEAIKNPITANPCACGCGRPVTGRATYAAAACRKRMQRRREICTP